jgi:hypothetical protein
MALGMLGDGGCCPEPQDNDEPGGDAQGGAGKIGFQSIPAGMDDTVRVPPGYQADVLFAWGDPVSDGPAFRQDAGNSAAEQAQQAGMHHDGQHFFPLPPRSHRSTHGLLAMNHEYTDEGLLHGTGALPVTAEKVAKSQSAVGVSVIEVRLRGGRWSVVRPSRHARRVTAQTPCAVSGPAAGHPLLATAADPTGRRVLGTMANCSHGVTPWGTFLTCEENFHIQLGADFCSPQSSTGASDMLVHGALQLLSSQPRRKPIGRAPPRFSRWWPARLVG